MDPRVFKSRLKPLTLYSLRWIILAATSLVNLAAAHSLRSIPPQVSSASLRCSPVNVRKGPGLNYPLEWILLCKGAPVKIIGTCGHWRKICDSLGSQGWVHSSMLSVTSTVIVAVSSTVLRSNTSPEAPGRAVLLHHVICQVLEKTPAWYRVKVQGFTGWVPQEDVWG